MSAKIDQEAPRGRASENLSTGAAPAEASFEKRAFGARGRRIFLFAAVFVLWVIFDQATKAYFNGSFHQGQVITDPIAGIFRFHLVYNTGGAWSIFSGATWALGVFSLVVCVALSAYALVTARERTAGEMVGLALIVAGGIGNAIDRFALGFVVDFIEPTFIDFPIFNIADIGVTCGFVILFVAFLLHDRARIRKEGGN